MRFSDASIKKPKVGMFSASTWLTIIVLGESACMVAWIAKEYFVFDYKCALPTHANRTTPFSAPAAEWQSESGGLGPRMVYAPAEGSLSRSSRNVSPFEADAFDDDVYPLDTIASASAHHRFRRDATQAEASDSEQATGEEGSGQMPKLRIIRRRKKKRPTAAADPQPTVESSVAIEPLRILESGVPERPLRTKTTWRKYHPRGVPTSVGTVIKRRRLKRPRTSPDLVPAGETVPRREHEQQRAEENPEGNATDAVPRPSDDADVTTASTVRTYIVEEDDFLARQDPQQARRPFESATYAHAAFEVRTTTRPKPTSATTVQTATPPTTTSPVAVRRPAIFEKAASLARPSAGHNFTEQLSTFTSSAMCAARTLAVVWCVLQVAAAVPFVVGIFARLRCLFTAHLILDALFLVVLFIYSVTMTIFALILFVCVADMSAQTLLEWLLFAAALDVLFVFYTTAFVATLRCCEELLADQPNSGVRTYRAKSLLYTQIPDADTLTDVNSV